MTGRKFNMHPQQWLRVSDSRLSKVCQRPGGTEPKTKRYVCFLLLFLLIALLVPCVQQTFASTQLCGPDARDPVIIKLRRGRTIRRRARKPYEALAHYRFDLSRPISFGERAARKIDEFGQIGFCDMQGRLDELANQLQSEPEAEGYIIVYGVRRNRGRSFEKQAFAKTAKDYLTKTRSIDRGRVFNVSGKDGDRLRVELWVVNPYRIKRN